MRSAHRRLSPLCWLITAARCRLSFFLHFIFSVTFLVVYVFRPPSLPARLKLLFPAIARACTTHTLTQTHAQPHAPHTHSHRRNAQPTLLSVSHVISVLFAQPVSVVLFVCAACLCCFVCAACLRCFVCLRSLSLLFCLFAQPVSVATDDDRSDRAARH